MPSFTPRQHRAMEAAKSGNSTIGIPQSVGAEFSAADEAQPKGTYAEKKPKSDFSKAMRGHGVSKGEHKRHPATSHYSSFGSEGNKYGKR
jgi:hypothetical protein